MSGHLYRGTLAVNPIKNYKINDAPMGGQELQVILGGVGRQSVVSFVFDLL